ncbi:hypothetical protein P8C59_006722 [Phyllachora maydis]|uniref:RNA polymerase II degradation factor 1 n=1 Tax=Phyllachora maydis TaxID=1825666 RepID=A0AAD9I6W3_9PEZI|nr:hypothetical protein P8C59_006722 [Phyllachora maydis]
MSEVQARPAPSRGRGSGRGGRGGYAARGGARSSNRPATNGDAAHETESALPSIEDQGDTGQLKKKYSSKVGAVKEMFPDWSEVDILYALHETNGDENVTVTRILEGTISQWGEVSNQKKERTRTKAKSDAFTTTTGESGTGTTQNRAGRGGRGGGEGGRGGRGRGGARGKSAHATTNGSRNKENAPLSVPAEDGFGWDNAQPSESTGADWGEPPSTSWDTHEPTESTEKSPAAQAPAASHPSASAPKTSIIPEGSQKTWASMLRQTAVPKPAPKPKETAVLAVSEPAMEPLPPAEPAFAEPESEAPTQAQAQAQAEPEAAAPASASTAEAIEASHVVAEAALPPPKDQLTETNVEQINDDAVRGPDTETVKSEAASSYDPRAAGASPAATPISASQQQHRQRAPASGHAATALKATERLSTRTPSYQRRVLDQEEAVRLPRGREQVEHATLQFGALGLDDEDIDGDREEPETRAQPPDDSPTAHPRTSLPPAQPAPAPVPAPVPAQVPAPEAFSAQKPAPVIPSAPAVTAPPTGPSQPSVVAQVPTHGPTQPSQYGRYGGQPAPEQSTFPTPKPFDSFGHASVPSTQSQYDNSLHSQSLPQLQQQTPQPQPGGAFSSAAPADYSSLYSADPQNRPSYSYYGQGYGQQPGSGQENLSQQHARGYGSYGAPQTDPLSQYPQSSQNATSRYASAPGPDAHNSGSNTPNPSQGQQQQAGQHAGQHAQTQSHGQQPHDYYGGGHPYYTNPYYANYMGYGQNFPQGYGASYGKNMNSMGYGHPQYGMQAPHGYGTSPAANGAFGQTSARDSAGAAGLGNEYGRAGAGGQQGLGGSVGFAGMHDSFNRSASGYSQGGGVQQPGSGVPGDELKPYGDTTKGAGGPSPSLGGARPGSAANNPGVQGPPQQQHQQAGQPGGMGGYPGYGSNLHGHGHGLHGGGNHQSAAAAAAAAASGYGGVGAGAHQSSSGGGGGGGGGFGGYGQQGGGGGYGGGSYYGNQGQQQATRGWGNNYH